MRILVISDIHANLAALEAVLADAGVTDAVWCLGDLVGYGPEPNACIERVAGLPNLNCLLGNHDAATLGQIDVEAFNLEARQSIEWIKTAISDRSLAFLRLLPEMLVTPEATLAHGSPRNPVWEYILDPRTAARNLDYFNTPLCFIGHTHVPVVYQFNPEKTVVRVIIPEAGEAVHVTEKAIINPGSVGQPRDRDVRAGYILFDTETFDVTFQRVAYDITSVQEGIRAAGLPARHALRLSEGW